MRYQWLTLAAALGIGIIGSSAHAVGNADYLAVRNKTAVTSVTNSENLAGQFPALAGQTIELEGVVSGVFSNDNSTGYLLRIDSAQTLILSAQQSDPDIAIGNTLRVLARIPSHGTVMDSISVTRQGTTLALSDLSNLRTQDNDGVTNDDTGFDPMPATKLPQIRYYQAPDLTPQTTIGNNNTTQAPVPESDLPLAQQQSVVQLYATRIQQFNSDIGDAVAQKIAYHLLDKSERNGVDPRLSFALVSQESRFNPRAVSPVGAQGLGQLMPGTAASMGISKPFDIEDNLDGTIRYLASQLNKYGRLSLALAAYNAGPGNVDKYGGVPPFRETQNYVKVIWGRYARLAGLDPVTGQQVANK